MVKFHFTTLTPLHISNGDEIRAGLEYVLFNRTLEEPKKLCKINFLKLSKSLSESNSFDFAKQYSLNSITDIIKNHLNSLFKKNELSNDYFLYRIPIDNYFKEQYDNPNAEGEKHVKEFINTNGKFYIPASSVKGALLTVLSAQKMGIDSNYPKINDRFVIRDSEFISESNFIIRRFDRPPPVNILCLKDGFSFDISVIKSELLNISLLKNKLENYYSKQLQKAKQFIEKFERDNAIKKPPTGETKGSNRFKKALNKIIEIRSNLTSDEYLINIGYGGGAYFKIFDKIEQVPKNNKGEYIHTSFSTIDEYLHIGWCKLKIEEC